MLKFLATKPSKPNDADGAVFAAAPDVNISKQQKATDPSCILASGISLNRIGKSPSGPLDRAADQRRTQRHAQPKKKGYPNAEANLVKQRSTTAFECAKKQMNARLHSLLGQNTNPAVQRALRYFFCYESDGLYPLLVAVYDLLETTLQERDELAKRGEQSVEGGLLPSLPPYEEEEDIRDILNRTDVVLPSPSRDYVVEDLHRKFGARDTASKRMRSKEEAYDDMEDPMDEEEREAEKNGISIDADDIDNDSEADEFEETEEDRHFINDDIEEEEEEESESEDVGDDVEREIDEENEEREPEGNQSHGELACYKRVSKKRRFAVLSEDDDEGGDDPVFRMA